jgi:DNA-directed RNA polymerase subunit beta'
MSEQVFDKVNDFKSARIGLASPSDIRSWSFGEVKKPETINYRTYRPEKDGLFCERIFGPERDYECGCGKYKGTKFKGIICDRCGVKVTHSRVRRKRMGHINLAAAVVHIWFFKALPSRLGTLLAMKTSDLEKIIYFQDYVVLDPGNAEIRGEPVVYKQVITEDDYRDEIMAKGGYGDFRAGMGADAVRELIEALDLLAEVEQLREDLASTRSKQKTIDFAKRLKLLEQLRKSHNEPSWMIIDVVPVIPPELRPLVMLESGNFATSDLNDLYRRIINRNNRLKKLMDLNAPEVIIRNEKRMLQQAVDALFDNGRCRRPVLGSSNRPLKSITDMIKGKQGRFRENLLGKRVDYSARSVIVVGPDLKLHQCGLPKKIALELYQPFIIRRLKEQGLADTIKSAKRMLERRDEEVWDILEQVIHQHPVLLNRAPTLHRMGIQAFEPILVEGKAITLHPLVCTGYNADFDGDQMAVHLPLSVEAQTEAHVLMLSTHNIFSPANGNPIVSPSQDIVMGVYFLTHMDLNDKRPENELMRFRNAQEAILAYDFKLISLQEKIQVRLPRYPSVVNDEAGKIEEVNENDRFVTTVGRILFCEILAEGMPFYNCSLTKKGCSRVIDDTYEIKGRSHTLTLLDDMKETGFRASTWSGLSIAITDMRIPSKKQELLDKTQEKVDRVEAATAAGAITNQERHNQLLDLWSHCRESLTIELTNTLENDRRNPEDNSELEIGSTDGIHYLNPVFLMSTSGARGNISQMQQLAGMRGLMTKPSGEIIETPIRANFREGLNVLEYFSSTHGARKGLADTALKTADSGYLTRKLYDVSQPVVINDFECSTKRGVTKRAVYKGDEIHVALRDLILGRTSMQTIVNPVTDKIIVSNKQVIDETIADELEGLNIDAVQVRSPLTCESASGCCALCYGHDLSTSQLVEEGMAVGTIAAQSIGEPGTQLTMRTFHTGGVASREFVETNYKAPHSGTMFLRDCNEVPFPDATDGQLIALKQTGELVILDDKGRELDKAFRVPYGSIIRVPSDSKVKKGNILIEWDPHVLPILAEKTGSIVFKDIEIGTTLREEITKGVTELIITEHTGDLHPQVLIQNSDGQTLDFHHLPAKARLEVKNGEQVVTGQMLARRPREVKGTADIVGGLPRVTEIFEARTPKEAAILAKVTGTVELQTERKRGKMVIHITPEGADPVEHLVPQGKHLLVHTGDNVIAGSQLTEGPRDPNNILEINGEEALYNYMISEVQNVYRAQGVPVSDKHIEVILSRMLSKIQVQKAGDTDLLPMDFVERYNFQVANKSLDGCLIIKDTGDTKFVEGDLVDKTEVKEANAVAEAEGKKPAKTMRPKKATGKPLLLGITKAALQSESFLSGASFQETTKVLTEAALRGAEDKLKGLKENVLLGHLVPAGTGFEPYITIKAKRLVDPPASDEDDEANMIAAATARAEALGAQPGGPTVQIPSPPATTV